MVVGRTLVELAAVTGGALEGSFEGALESIRSLENAGPRDIAIVYERGDASLFAPLHREKIQACRAGVILARHVLIPGRAHIITPDPLAAYQALVAFLHEERGDEVSGIDPTARIASGVLIGEDVVVGPYALVGSGVRIERGARVGAHAIIESGASLGAHTRIGARVVIGRDCSVGAHSLIHAGTVVGSDGFGYEVAKTGLRKIPHTGVVQIGSHVEIGANCAIDRATFDATVIGDGTKIDNLVHIGHNVHIGASTAILASTIIGGSARIGNGCQIGGHVTIMNGVTIGDRANVVSKSGVLKHVASGETVAGIPAHDFSEWKRQYAYFQLLYRGRRTSSTVSSGVLQRCWSWIRSLFRI